MTDEPIHTANWATSKPSFPGAQGYTNRQKTNIVIVKKCPICLFQVSLGSACFLGKEVPELQTGLFFAREADHPSKGTRQVPVSCAHIIRSTNTGTLHTRLRNAESVHFHQAAQHYAKFQLNIYIICIYTCIVQVGCLLCSFCNIAPLATSEIKKSVT